MIAVDIGDAHIKVATLDGVEKKMSLRNYTVIPVEGGLIDQNQKLNTELLKRHLHPVFSKLSGRDVVISFSCLDTVANRYTLPAVKNRKVLRQMVNSKVYQNLSPTEYITDFTVDSVINEDGKQLCMVTAYILPRALVLDVYKCIAALGKRPRRLDVAQNCAFSFARRFVTQTTFMIVNLSGVKITAHLINRPGDIITRVSNLRAQTDEFSGLFGAAAQPDSGNLQEHELQSLVSKLIQYQTIKYPGETLEGIYLTGTGATAQLAEALSLSSDLPTRVLGLDWQPIKLNANDDAVSALFYNIGAALGGGNVNFFEVVQHENRRVVDKRRLTASLVAMAVVTVELLFFTFLYHQQARFTQSIDGLQEVLIDPQTNDLLIEDRKQRNGIIANERGLLAIEELEQTLEYSNGFTVDIYNRVEAARPPTVQLVSLSFSDGVISMVCTTQNDAPPADFVKSLEQTGIFDQVGYNGFSQGSQAFSFNVTCTLAQGRVTDD